MTHAKSPSLLYLVALTLTLTSQSTASTFNWGFEEDDVLTPKQIKKPAATKRKRDAHVQWDLEEVEEDDVAKAIPHKKKNKASIVAASQGGWLGISDETKNPKAKKPSKTKAKRPVVSDDEVDDGPIAARKKSRKSKSWYKAGDYATLNKGTDLTGPDFLGEISQLDLDDIEEILTSVKGVELDDEAREILGLITLKKKMELAAMERQLEKDDSEDLEENLVSIEDLVSGSRKKDKGELGVWEAQIEHLKSVPKVYAYAKELAKDVELLGAGSEAGAIKKSQLKLIIGLPWDKTSEIKIDIQKGKKILDDSHFGMEKIKERILEYLAVQKRDPDAKGNILCFVGPPGVGKTTLCEAIAEATGRKFVSVALGGVHDEPLIRGHAPAYIGAGPGQIAKKLKLAGVNNPLMLLDEIDKLGEGGSNGNPAYALLEVLDPAQNKEFEDHFIDDLPLDLSKIMFVTTANTEEKIYEPLRDRLEIIHLSSYTNIEKLQIALKYLVPKMKKENKINNGELHIRTATIARLIEQYTQEAGVRSLSKLIAKLCRKVVKQNTDLGKIERVIMEPNMLEKYLGPPKHLKEKPLERDMVGHCMGLYYTTMGGGILPIEVAISEGDGKILRTGALGEVMKESVDAAWSVARTLVGKYNVTEASIKDKNVHVHFYEASTPKDGPSAGAAITTTMVSALGKMAIRKDVCMTGEITLGGTVQAIGGLKDKLIGAHRVGMKIAMIPKDNIPDLQDVPEVVKKGLKIIPVSHISEVLDIALVK